MKAFKFSLSIKQAINENDNISKNVYSIIKNKPKEQIFSNKKCKQKSEFSFFTEEMYFLQILKNLTEKYSNLFAKQPNIYIYVIECKLKN